MFEGIAKTKRTDWSGHQFYTVEEEMPVFKVEDSGGRFSFVFHDCGDGIGYVVLAEVVEEHRGKKLSRTLLQAMHHVWFDEWGFRTVYGRAAVPLRDPNPHDWREEKVVWKRSAKSGVPIRTTALHRMWLRSPLAVHGKEVVQDLEDDSVAWLSPHRLRELDQAELERLDRAYPKERRESFRQLADRDWIV